MPTATTTEGDMITPDQTRTAGGPPSAVASAEAQAVSTMTALTPQAASAPPAGTVKVASGVQCAIDKVGGCESVGTMLKELSFQTKLWKLRKSDSDTAERQETDFLGKVIGGAQLFGWVCMRGKFLRLVHSLGGYMGDLIDVSEYDGHVIGFTGDRTDSTQPTAVTFGAGVDWQEDDEGVTSESTLVSSTGTRATRTNFTRLQQTTIQERTTSPCFCWSRGV